MYNAWNIWTRAAFTGGVGTLLMFSAVGQTLQWLGRPLGENAGATPTGVSANGTVVSANVGLDKAYVWEQGEWRRLLSNTNIAHVNCLSADGARFGGGYAPSRTQNQLRAYQLIGNQLTQVHAPTSEIVDMSADGSILLGSAVVSGAERAFVWSGAQAEYIQPPSYFLSTTPYGLSPDGSVAVGYAFYTSGGGSAGETRAFRWSAATGSQLLPQLAGANYSRAHAAALNGNVIVGVSFVNGIAKMTRWQGNSVQDLGTLSGYYYTEATDVSELGNIAVGYAYDGDNYRAVLWTSTQGLQDMNVRYAHLLSPGSYLMTAKAISHNGRYVVGMGYNAQSGREEPYLLTTGLEDSCLRPEGDADGNNCVDDTDVLLVLFRFGQTGDDLGRLDQNCDQRIDDADLLIVLFNFGRGCR